MVDTNSDPSNVDFVIPANDDASKSIELILDTLCSAMAEGLEERKVEKVDQQAAGEDDADKGARRERRRISRNNREDAAEETEVVAEETTTEEAE